METVTADVIVRTLEKKQQQTSIEQSRILLSATAKFLFINLLCISFQRLYAISETSPTMKILKSY